jgi:tetratricopeptide (TPR) repeat protein
LRVTRASTTHRTGQHSRQDRESTAALARLESLYQAGQYAQATALAESMLGLPGSAFFQGRVRLHLAMTYLQLGKPDLGKPPLAEARAHFEAIGDAEMIVECMVADAAVACLEQRPDGLGLAMRALTACRSLRKAPNTLELRILTLLASAQSLVGQKSEAIKTFEEAIRLADPVVDMRQLGKLLGNAGIAYRELGQLERAISYSNRAVALLETVHDLVSLAREENNLGCYHIGRGELTLARSHLERSLQLFDETKLQKARGILLLSLCELCLAEGDVEEATTYADAAIEAGESQNEVWSVADGRLWKGRIATRRGDDVTADHEFQSAVAILESSGMTERLIDCHAEHAEMLERRGDLPGAYEHLKVAFRLRTRKQADVW